VEPPEIRVAPEGIGVEAFRPCLFRISLGRHEQQVRRQEAVNAAGTEPARTRL